MANSGSIWNGAKAHKGLVLTLVTAVLAGSLALYRTAQHGHPAPVHYKLSNLKPLRGQAIAPLLALNQAREAIVSRIMPAVVNIAVTAKAPAHKEFQQNSPFGQFFQFFGQPRQPQFDQGIGSGFIISPEGYIVTNRHVVANATYVEVTMHNHVKYRGKVLGTDALTDLAVVKINAQNLPSVPWGDSRKLRVGEAVLAFGNPFMLNFTVTHGIISGLHRRSYLESHRAASDMIQTDTPINPGNSGGPLVDAHGDVIGIDAAILTPSGAFAGVGYAIPSDLARPITDQIIRFGHVEHGFLGVGLNALTPSKTRFFGLPANASGVLISSVIPHDPGAKAGLEEGDVIVSYNHHPIHSMGQLQVLVQLTRPGTRVPIGIMRNGKPIMLHATVGQFHQPARKPSKTGEIKTSGVRLGIQFETLTQQIRDQLNIPNNIHGAIIESVVPGSPAYNAELRRGMVIQEVNRQPVTSARQLQTLLSQAPAGKSVLLLVYLNGGSAFIVVRMNHP